MYKRKIYKSLIIIIIILIIINYNNNEINTTVFPETLSMRVYPFVCACVWMCVRGVIIFNEFYNIISSEGCCSGGSG